MLSFAIWCNAQFAQVGDFFARKRVRYTLRLQSPALDFHAREILSIGCRLGQPLNETSLLCQQKPPFVVLGSKKILSHSAAGLLQIEVCHWGPHFHILLLRCSLFQLFQVYEGWWPDDVANTIEACLEFNSVHLGQFCKNSELWRQYQWFSDNALR